MYFRRIADLRVDSDLTQRAVAAHLNMNLEVYRRYEKGELVTSPMPEEAPVIKAVLHMMTIGLKSCEPSARAARLSRSGWCVEALFSPCFRGLCAQK